MSDLIQAGEKTWYIKGWAYTGFYLQDDKNVYIVDSGNSDESGERIASVIDEKGWKLKGILNTHGHTDHYGGNHYLQQRYGCPAFAKASEADVLNHSYLEPYLLNGALPFSEIRQKGLMIADASVCSDVSDERFPEEVKVIDLPGHSPDHVGYLMPDGTLFAGDAIVGFKDIERYQVQYIYSPGEYLKSIETLRSCGARRFVLGHGGLVEEPDELIEENISALENVQKLLLERMEKPATMDDLLEAMFSVYHMPLDYGQYTLIGSIVKSYIAWMKDENLIEGFAEDNRFYWKAAE